MIMQVTWYNFENTFLSSDTYKGNFTHEGLKALYDYMNELEESTDEQIEFDMIAICCDYTEFDNLEDVQSQYPDIKSLDDLKDNTQVIECDNGHLIISNF